MTYRFFSEALEELRKTLYANNLYPEGQISIIYDKNANDFYIAEFPLKSNVYISPNEVAVLNVEIDKLNELYLNVKGEYRRTSFSDIVDSFLDIIQDEQIIDEKVGIVNE